MDTLLLSGLMLLAGAWEQTATQAFPRHSRSQVENDLKLEASLMDNGPFEVGESIRIRWQIKNISCDATYMIVKPGDGSEVGWREPHLFYTAKRQVSEDCYEPVAARQMGRCGLYAIHWQKDVVALLPQQTLTLEEWVPTADQQLDLFRPGQVRIQAHYRFTRGRATKGAPAAKEALAALVHMPSFELVSTPIECEILRPLDLVIHSRPHPCGGSPQLLSDCVEVSLVNRDKKTRTISIPSGSLQVADPTYPGILQSLNSHSILHREIVLAPDERIMLVGPEPGDYEWRWNWAYQRPPTVTIVARLHLMEQDKSKEVHSEELTLDIGH